MGDPSSDPSSETKEPQSEEPPVPPASPGADSTSAGALLEEIGTAPALAGLAALAALAEMLLSRALPPALGGLLSHDALIGLRRLAQLPRNLAALAGILAITVALLAFLRTPGYAPIRRRLAAAAFSGVLMPTLVMATLLPPERTSYHLILFAIASASVLASLLHLTAFRYAARYEWRLASIGVLISGLSALLVVVLSQVAPLTRLASARAALVTLRHAGELAWLAVPLMVALGIRKKRKQTRALAVAFAALILGAGLAFALHGLERERSQSVVYATLRALLLLEQTSWIYAFPFAIGLVGAIDALLSREPNERQIGWGAMLWLVSGYAPHTPIQLMSLVLASLLLARAVQGDDRSGEWQHRWPWSLLGVPNPTSAASGSSAP